MIRTLCVCLYLKGNADLYLNLLMLTKQAAIYSSCLFKWRLLTGVIIYRSRWPVQYIRHCVMFCYRYLILANHCHTTLWTVKLTVAQPVTVLFYRHKCCFNKQLPNKHTFTALPSFPLYHGTLCQHIHNIHPVLWCTEATIKLFIVTEWMTKPLALETEQLSS